MFFLNKTNIKKFKFHSFKKYFFKIGLTRKKKESKFRKLLNLKKETFFFFLKVFKMRGMSSLSINIAILIVTIPILYYGIGYIQKRKRIFLSKNSFSFFRKGTCANLNFFFLI